jgi:predicted Zn-dependent peptidase
MHISYEYFELANGLKVYVNTVPGVSKVAFNLLYNVGAKDEYEHRTGLAHLFEHLMFSGSKHIPDYDRHVQLAGGQNNAFTNSDITNYYLTVPANQLETAFWLESDRMLSLDFSQRNLDIQKSVVCEEFKQRYLNQPYGDAYLYLRPLHYRVHPYKWMTIGKELAHIEDVTLPEIEDFFFRFYAPNNAVLALSGAVTVSEAQELAEKWFGSIPRRLVQRPAYDAEPLQTEARTETVIRKVPSHAVYRAYHLPSRLSPDFYAADLIADVLGNGSSAPFHQYLVKNTQVAADVFAFTWGLHDHGLLTVGGIVTIGNAASNR